MTTINEWGPLVIAFAILTLATVRGQPNYLAVIIAGAFFVYSGFSPVWDEPGLGMMVVLFGTYNILAGVLELLSPDENEGDENYEEN